MSTELQYKVYCNTDGQFESVWLPESSALPSVCPINAAHAIDLSKLYVSDRRVQDEFLASATILQGDVSLIGFPVGLPLVVGRVTTAPSAFLGSALAKGLTRMVGAYKADGTIGLNVIERLASGTEASMHGSTPSLPSTGGVWTPFLLTTTIPPNAGLNEYRLEAWLDTAVIANLRGLSLSLLKHE